MLGMVLPLMMDESSFEHFGSLTKAGDMHLCMRGLDLDQAVSGLNLG